MSALDSKAEARRGYSCTQIKARFRGHSDDPAQVPDVLRPFGDLDLQGCQALAQVQTIRFLSRY
jgi:hypothetical protein